MPVTPPPSALFRSWGFQRIVLTNFRIANSKAHNTTSLFTNHCTDRHQRPSSLTFIATSFVPGDFTDRDAGWFAKFSFRFQSSAFDQAIEFGTGEAQPMRCTRKLSA